MQVKKILSYIKERDILDLDAYIGDSALVLSNYTNAKVYSYELSKKTAEMYEHIMQLNNIKIMC